MKNLVLPIIIFGYFFGIFQCFASVDNLQGYIGKQELLYNNLKTENLIKTIKISPNTEINSANLKENDEFFAHVSEDLIVENNIVVPKGSIVHCFVDKVKKTDSFNRNAKLDIKTDYIIIQNKKFPLEGVVNIPINHTKEFAQKLSTDMVYTLTGTTVGALGAINLLGIDGAVASSGTTLATGGAIGGAIGLTQAISQKGKDIIVESTDEIEAKVNINSEIPTCPKNQYYSKKSDTDKHYLAIKNIEYKKNKYGKTDIVKISFLFENKTSYTFAFSDIYLLDSDGKKYYPNIFEDENIKFLKINPYTKQDLILPFAVNNVKETMWLVVENRKNKEKIAKFPLNKAYPLIPKKQQNENNRLVNQKKSFYAYNNNPFGL